MDYREIKFESESDVEQKLIYNLLVNQPPFGLGFTQNQIKTKPDIRKLKIDKGNSSKYYYPDYVVIVEGIPAMIIEAKNYDEDPYEGYREARLYSNEINASFPQDINPCKFIIACNGLKLLFGYWDSDHCQEISQQDYYIANTTFSTFVEKFSKERITKELNELLIKFRGGTRFWKPTYMLGGSTIRNISVGQNGFGNNLSLEYKYLFNPESKDEREMIVRNAYVASKRRLAHVTPIDKLIRNTLTPSSNSTISIRNTSEPKEIIDQIKDIKRVKKQICLLVGSVGSGKSTFMDYLYRIALPSELLDETRWITLNLNTAPIDNTKIYDWVLDKVILELKLCFKDSDFENINFIKRIFSNELKAKQSLLSILGEGSDEYNKELYKILKELLSDKIRYFYCLVQYFFVNKNKLLIIVLDNCDKRSRDEQLLMFEVANWLKDSFDLMVFLPLRESTYDLYKNEPPLDTVIKDLVFRIDPPLLIHVIQKRIDYALKEIECNVEGFVYFLQNGIQIKCKRSEIGNYLRSILHTLFQNDFFKKLLIGLTGRNIRKGLEIFLDFCKSGHLKEDIIFKMRTTEVAFKIPNHIISRVILRGTRLYYDENYSYIKNIFSSSEEDNVPDPFVRISILSWLRSRQRIPGPSNIKGYHRTSDLVDALKNIGHNFETIIREMKFLQSENCIISESQENKFNLDNLICITSAGIVLLDLISNIDYLSTVSEDTYFRDNETAKKIADNILGKGDEAPLSKRITIENASYLIDYLKTYKQKYWFSTLSAIENEDYVIDSVLDESWNLINRAKEKDVHFIESSELLKRYPVGSLHSGIIVSIQPYGLIVQIGLNASGLVHTSVFNDEHSIDDYEVGDEVEVEILDLEQEKKKFSLKLNKREYDV